MRIETELAARPAVSRRAAPIALACVLALAGLARPAYAAAAVAAATTATAAPSLAPAPRDGGAGAFGSGATVALEEQNLPSEDLASPAASPAAASPAPPSGSPSPGAAGDNGGPGAQAPAGQPAAQAPTQQPARQGTGARTRPGRGRQARPQPARLAPAAATGAPAVPAGAPVAGGPAPEATPTDAPPPYDVGSIQPTAPVSDQPLTALIASTKDQPALNASLRFAEQGRKVAPKLPSLTTRSANLAAQFRSTRPIPTPTFISAAPT